jgi:hypothetical protein
MTIVVCCPAGTSDQFSLRRWIICPPRWAGLIPSAITTAVLVALGGCVLLLSLPVSRYLILRRHLHRAWRWIPITVLAWSIGLLWTLAPSPLSTSRLCSRY